MGLLSLGTKLSKVSKKLKDIDLSDVDTPVSTSAITKPKKLDAETNVSFETEEALEMLSNEKSIEEWKINNKVPKEESKRRKQRKFSEQAKDLEAGIMSGPAYRKYIKENQPATSFSEKDLDTMLPNFKNVVGALTKDKSDKGILGLNNNLEKGSVVTSRLDIPAYNEYNVWVTSIVDKIKGKLYGRTAVLKNVNFDMTNEGAKRLALDIATEKKKTKKVLNKKTQERVTEEYTQTKTPFATMKGEWQDVLDEDAFSLAKKYINDPDWIQVGFNPERHSFFYDKATMMPVFEAEEVVQVGALVLAKVKKLNTPELRAARIAKLRKLRITNMPEGAKPTTFNKGGAILMNNQMQQFAEGGLKDEGGMIDEVSGNEVPIGGTKEGVRDDIPANVSEGEFIFPADVVRFVGLDKLMSIRQKAKMGLQKMEDMGQMGNSDEATIPDDMPFGMADIMVIGDKGEPMEFANGGFVPSYAPGGMVELETAYVPTTGTEEIDYDAYMNSVTTVTKEYKNAAGESVVITFINGVPTLPIPDGYTLYTPVAGEGGTTSIAGQVVSQTASVPSSNDNNDNTPDYQEFAPESIDYRGMSDEQFAAQMQGESTGLSQFGRAIGLGISSMVPFGTSIIYTGMRSHARRSEERLNVMIEESSGEQKAQYIAIRDAFLKSYSLKPADKSNSIVAALDSYLTKNGYTQDQIKAATFATSLADSKPLISENAQRTINEIIEGKPLTSIAAGNEPGMVGTDINSLPDSTAPSQTAQAFEDLGQAPFAMGGRQVGRNLDADMDTSNRERVSAEELKSLQDSGKLEGLNPNARLPTDISASGVDYEGIERVDTGTGGQVILKESEAPDLMGPEVRKFYNNERKRYQLNNVDLTGEGDNQGAALASMEQAGMLDTYPMDKLYQAQRNQQMSDGRGAGQKAVGSPAPAPIAAGNEPGMTGSTQYNRPEAPSYFDSTEVGGILKYAYETVLDSVKGSNFKDTPVTNTQPYAVVQANPVVASTPIAAGNEPGMTGSTQYNRPVVTPAVTEQQPDATSGYDFIPQSFSRTQQQQPDATSGYDFIPQSFSRTQQQQPDATSGYDFIPDGFSRTQQQTDRVLGLSPAPGEMVNQTPKLKTAAQIAKERQTETNNRALRAEQAAADARQNNAFQTAANELTPDDGKEYQKGVLRSTTGANEGKQINTAYQTAANLATPGDGLKYTGGELRDSDGNRVNSFFQKAANALTPFDGKSYIKGKLVDKKGKRVIPTSAKKEPVRLASNDSRRYMRTAVPDSENTNIQPPPFAPESRFYGTPAPAPAPVASQRDNSGSSNNTAADVQASFHGPKTSPRPKARPKARNFGGSSQVRAEGGLIQKPAKIKKPAKAKTKKRGLAARK